MIPASNFDAALMAAKYLGPVFPCRHSGQQQKRPAFKGWQEIATRDAERIATWWGKEPNHLPGLLTGDSSGLTVLDVDVKDG